MASKVGPGSYTENSQLFGSRSSFSATNRGHFGKASREQHWSKYASEHAVLVEKGLM